MSDISILAIHCTSWQETVFDLDNDHHTGCLNVSHLLIKLELSLITLFLSNKHGFKFIALLFTGDISQPSQSNRSPTQMSPQQNRKRARAEVDDQITSIPMLVQALLFQDFNKIFGKQTKIESRCLRWGDVSLHRDPETESEWLILQRGGSRAYGGQGEHPLQRRAVTLYKIFQKKRPSEAKNCDSSFYLAVKPKVKDEDPVWYMNKPQAVNKIGKCQITRKSAIKRPRL